MQLKTTQFKVKVTEVSCEKFFKSVLRLIVDFATYSLQWHLLFFFLLVDDRGNESGSRHHLKRIRAKPDPLYWPSMHICGIRCKTFSFFLLLYPTQGNSWLEFPNSTLFIFALSTMFLPFGVRSFTADILQVK